MPFFGQVLDSGGHAASLQLLQTDRLTSPAAPIDCDGFALLAEPTDAIRSRLVLIPVRGVPDRSLL